jgi:hypothetical protein
MDAAIAFILGLLYWGSFGVFAIALLTAAKWQDEQFIGNGRWENEHNDPGRND